MNRSVPGPPELGELAREHFRNPRNTGPWPDTATGLRRVAGEAGSVASGAFVRFQLALDGECIVAVRYEVLGGPALMATASWLSEYLTGRRVTRRVVPPGLDMARLLELDRVEHGMALLAEDAALRALNARGSAPI